MARIVGVDIPNEKSIVVGLTHIFGIGMSTSKKILKAVGVDPNVKVKSVSEEDFNKIRQEISSYKVEGDLRREVLLNIKRLQEIGCYRGIRHRKGLPCNGQRTKTNARTRKGPRKTIANKKEVSK